MLKLLNIKIIVPSLITLIFLCLFGLIHITKNNQDINDKINSCSPYLEHTQKYLDLYQKRNESTELIDFIRESQAKNPDISLLNIYIGKMVYRKRSNDDISMEVMELCMSSNRDEFLRNIFIHLKNDGIIRAL